MCFSPFLGMGCVWGGGGGTRKDLYTTCSCNFSPWGAQKWKFLKLVFFYIQNTYNDPPRYVEHFLARIYVVFAPFGCVLLGVDSLRHGLAEDIRKIFISVITRYVKHGLGRIYVVFTLFGSCVFFGGGVSQGIGTKPAHVVFHLGRLKNRSFRKIFF